MVPLDRALGSSHGLSTVTISAAVFFYTICNAKFPLAFLFAESFLLIYYLNIK